jgi:hypothetical protein
MLSGRREKRAANRSNRGNDMGYLIGHLWPWLLIAFIAGAIIGWKTCGRKSA